MKPYLIIIIYLTTLFSTSAQHTVSGGIGTPYFDELNSTNTEKIYVLNTLINSQIEYSIPSHSIVRFYKYTFAQEDRELIPLAQIQTTSTANTTTYIIRNLEDSKGYYAEVDDSISTTIWIINYDAHLPELKSIQTSEEDDKCSRLKLIIDKSDDLYFYTPLGAKRRVSRRYDIEYKNLTWDQQQKNFVNKIEELKSIDIGTEYVIEDAPLIDTDFTLTGDQFAKHFGMNFQITSPIYSAVAVEAHIIAEQLTQNQDDKSSELGAPVEFQFYGMGNEPTAYYYTWFIYKNGDNKNPIVRYTDRDVTFTFRESGDYTVKLEVTDQSSQCVQSDSIQIQTSSSLLDVPNFLVLDGEHKFRVTYKSLSTFKCSIFNRWGNKIYEFTDPSEGWDGRYNGRYVTPGVYFYVIRARGADGQDRSKAGDINVLKRK